MLVRPHRALSLDVPRVIVLPLLQNATKITFRLDFGHETTLVNEGSMDSRERCAVNTRGLAKASHLSISLNGIRFVAVRLVSLLVVARQIAIDVSIVLYIMRTAGSLPNNL